MQPREAPANLHDNVLPEAVSWVPETVGWWVLLGLVVLALAWGGGRRSPRGVGGGER